jgi:hypothetical protein
MTAVLIPAREALQAPDSPALFQVWIDLNFGEGAADWWWNSEPQPLRSALGEAAETRAGGWVCCVLPEGQNPRPDGRWDNP